MPIDKHPNLKAGSQKWRIEHFDIPLSITCYPILYHSHETHRETMKYKLVLLKLKQQNQSIQSIPNHNP